MLSVLLVRVISFSLRLETAILYEISPQETLAGWSGLCQAQRKEKVYTGSMQQKTIVLYVQHAQ
jgi:hypothetical protein